MNKLFPDENPEEALKRELLTLTVEDYMQTVKDYRFPKEAKCENLEKFIMERKMSILRYG